MIPNPKFNIFSIYLVQASCKFWDTQPCNFCTWSGQNWLNIMFPFFVLKLGTSWLGTLWNTPCLPAKRAFCEQWQAWHLPSKNLKPHIPTKAKFGTSKMFWQNRPCFLFFQDPSALTCSVAIRNFPGRQWRNSDVTTTCHFFALCGRCYDWARANYRCRSCDQCSNLIGALKENGVPLFLSWICFGRAWFFDIFCRCHMLVCSISVWILATQPPLTL